MQTSPAFYKSWLLSTACPWTSGQSPRSFLCYVESWSSTGVRRDQALRNAMVWVPGGKIFTKAAAAMCREIFCSRRLPFPWLCSGNVIPCSFMMQGGFPLWIAIAYGKAQYSSCQNPWDLPVGNREDLCSRVVAFSFSCVRSMVSHTVTVRNCLFLADRKHWLQTYCLLKVRW